MPFLAGTIWCAKTPGTAEKDRGRPLGEGQNASVPGVVWQKAAIDPKKREMLPIVFIRPRGRHQAPAKWAACGVAGAKVERPGGWFSNGFFESTSRSWSGYPAGPDP